MEEIEEANKAAVENCHRVLSIISSQAHENRFKLRYLADETEKSVSKFKKVVRILGKEVGHARARIVNRNRSMNLVQNGPKTEQNDAVVGKGFQLFKSEVNEGCVVQENGSVSGKSCLSLGNDLSLGLGSSNGKIPAQNGGNGGNMINPNVHFRFLQQQQQLQQKVQMMKHQAEMVYRRSNSGVSLNFDNSSYGPAMSSARSFISSLSVDGSVASLDGKGFNLIGVSHASDPNLSHFKKRCYGARSEDGSVKCGGPGKCHCSKKRKHRVKRTIKVPAISNKLADIPADDYSWRKYGQKPIKGSPHPRGYYKCSTVRGCPARKHVERCLEEPSMLIVTYEGDHSHHQAPVRSANA
ncbi:hypothetical protein vseg_014014 [Gypsophila vaccaria]